MLRSNRKSFEKKVVLLTGATDGIGLLLAHKLKALGARVLTVGRRSPDEADRLGIDRACYCQSDLSLPACGEQVASFVQEKGVAGIDLLIHNAGTGYYGKIQDQGSSDIRRLVQVNLSAPVALSHSLYPYVESYCGKIVFIGSVVSSLACPEYAVYAATKAALLGFSRSLSAESDAGIRVQMIQPGATRTGFHEKIGMTREVVDWNRFPSADRVAGKILRAIQSRKKRVTIGMGNTLLWTTGRYLSRLTDALMRSQ